MSALRTVASVEPGAGSPRTGRGALVTAVASALAGAVLLVFGIVTLAGSTSSRPEFASARWAAAGATDPGSSAAPLGRRQDLEAHLAGKANALLEGIVGTGRYVVEVNAELAPADAATAPVVKRLSVAVALDDAPAATGGVTRSEEQLAHLHRLVSTAIGLVPDRGDTLDLVSLPFAPSASGPMGTKATLLLAATCLTLGLSLLVLASMNLGARARPAAAPPSRTPSKASVHETYGDDESGPEPEALAALLAAFATREDGA